MTNKMIERIEPAAVLVLAIGVLWLPFWTSRRFGAFSGWFLSASLLSDFWTSVDSLGWSLVFLCFFLSVILGFGGLRRTCAILSFCSLVTVSVFLLSARLASPESFSPAIGLWFFMLLLVAHSAFLVAIHLMKRPEHTRIETTL